MIFIPFIVVSCIFDNGNIQTFITRNRQGGGFFCFFFLKKQKEWGQRPRWLFACSWTLRKDGPEEGAGLERALDLEPEAT